MRLAIQCRTDQSFTSPPPRDVSGLAMMVAGGGGSCGEGGGSLTAALQFLLDIARQKNQTPLPLIKPYSGPRLPPDRYCLTAPNYRLKSLQKKVRAAGARTRLAPALRAGRWLELGISTP